MGSTSLGLELEMNRLVILAACVCASSAQVLVGAPARAIAPAQSHQFHAQDELGQFSYGYAGGNSAKTEARNSFGVTTGSYQYVDSYGLLQTVNYVADPVHGFRVSGTNVPVAPAVPAAIPLKAPVFDLPIPVAVQDTPEVAAAKAEFKAAFDAAAVASVEKRSADAAEIAVAAPAANILAHNAIPYAAGVYAAAPYATYAAAPYATYAAAPVAAAVAAPVATYAAAPVAAAVAAPVATYAAAPAVAAAVPVAATASRKAIKTTVKLPNAVFYRVD